MKAAKIRLKEKWGLDPVVHAEVPKAATDVGASVLKIKQANPDVLISVGWPRNITPLLRQAKELGLNVPHVGASGADIAEITMAGSFAKDHISHLMTNDLAEGDAPGMKKFRESFAKEYPEVAKGLGRPGLWDAVGYASMHLVADAMKKAGRQITRANFMKALETTKEYTGRDVWMPITFTPDFHDGLHKMKFYKVVDKKGNRIVLPEWYGSTELLVECSKRSLPEYQKMLQKDYLNMLKESKN